MRHVAVLARAPSDRGKTRLTGHLPDLAAHALREALLADTLDVVRATGVRLTLFFTPARARDEVSGLVLDGEGLAPQAEGDLGARMSAAVDQLFGEGVRYVVLIGSDLPSLPAPYVHEAFAALEATADVAIGPAADGGYYLVGMARPQPALFEGIEWGGPAVLERTLHAAAEHHLRVSTVPGWYDVDTAEDLARVLGSREPAVRTRAWLEEYGAPGP